ncbi:MAG: acyltransferase domain-containing protein [Planctomycetota bacterium]
MHPGRGARAGPRPRSRVERAAPGAMAAACAAPERVAGLLRDLGGACWVAAANGSQDSVLAGPPAALEDALALLRLEGVEVRPLAVSYAAHGPAVAPGLRAIEAAARQVPWAAPRCGWISSLDGASVQAPPTPAHWRRQTLEPVRFAEALGALRARGVEVLLELGPGASLSRLAARALPSARTLTSAPGEADPARHLLEVAARLWEAGHPVTWERLLADLS